MGRTEREGMTGGKERERMTGVGGKERSDARRRKRR